MDSIEKNMENEPDLFKHIDFKWAQPPSLFVWEYKSEREENGGVFSDKFMKH